MDEVFKENKQMINETKSELSFIDRIKLSQLR